MAGRRGRRAVEWPGNEDRLGNWTYCGTVDGSNRRLAGDNCTEVPLLHNMPWYVMLHNFATGFTVTATVICSSDYKGGRLRCARNFCFATYYRRLQS
jgi:hypothetical protein